MQYWADGYAVCVLALLALIFVGGQLRRLVPERFPLPRAMLAGLLGLVLGPSFVDLLPLEVEQLEAVVYHGLALVFISVSLQTPHRADTRSGDVVTIGLGIPMVTALQGAVGMMLVLAWNLGGGRELHPGFGLMAPLGFSQGPGQALAMGSAWSAYGLRDGAAVGLLVAGSGFIWCTVFGTLWLGRRPDLLERARASRQGNDEGRPELSGSAIMRNVLAVGLVYFGTWLLLRGADFVVVDRPQLRAMMWGFHFLIGLGLAMATRAVVPRVTTQRPLDNATLGALAGIVVEVTTAAALTALSARVFADWWLPILLLVGLAGGITMLVCWLLERYAFATFPFEHAVLLMGATTGTLLTGMALLRAVDARLESPVASNQVLASAVAIPFTAPVILLVMPYAVATWEPGSATAAAVAFGLLLMYAAVLMGLMALWRRRTQNSMASPK